MVTAVLLLALGLVAPAAAQPGPDTMNQQDVVAAAKQALDSARRDLGRWLTVCLLAALLLSGLVVWRIWAFGRALGRLEDMRSAWDTKFSEAAADLLKMKRKQADLDAALARMETDMARLRPVNLETAAAETAAALAGLQLELKALRERLERSEEKLEAVADHTVVTKRDRAAVEELVRTAQAVKADAEAAAGRAAHTLGVAQADLYLHSADAQFKQGRYEEAAGAYAAALEMLKLHKVSTPSLEFHAQHNRLAAFLKTGRFDSVLAEVPGLAQVAHPKAGSAARLLSGAARLGLGSIDEAIRELGRAVKADTEAAAVIQSDEDIAAWLKANPRKAGPLRKFLKGLKTTRAARSKPKRRAT
jgi:tetratricopeptide (TPR) repeat protein